MDPHKSFALLAIGPGESKSHQEDTIVDHILRAIMEELQETTREIQEEAKLAIKDSIEAQQRFFINLKSFIHHKPIYNCIICGWMNKILQG